MVKTPFCNFCLQTGMLCSLCQSKIERGELSKLDEKTAKDLLELENEYPSLKDIEFIKGVEVGPLIVILVGIGDLPKLIGGKGKIVRALGKKLGKKVRVAEATSQTKKLIEDLLTPATVLGVNTIFLPDGEMVKKVRIRKLDSEKLPAGVELLEKTIWELTKERIKFVFE